MTSFESLSEFSDLVLSLPAGDAAGFGICTGSGAAIDETRG